MTKNKRHKTNSNETMRQEEYILYSNPHSRTFFIVTWSNPHPTWTIVGYSPDIRVTIRQLTV
jgi:hypothetical protein